MTILGIAVIGQAPRDDIAALFGAALPAGSRTVLRGCLDGLSEGEIDALAPQDGADTLYTRLPGAGLVGAGLPGGRDARISKAAVIARAPATLARLRDEGCDAIVFACTGHFPPMPGDSGVVFPSRVLAGLAAGLLPAGRLGLLVPAPEQVESLSAKWRRDGLVVVAEALLPSAGPAEAAAAARRLAQGRPELVAMDCMSYTPAAKAAVKAELGLPTLLGVSATARILGELLA